MQPPLLLTERLDASKAALLIRATGQRPLLALLRPAVIEALEGILNCGRELTTAEVAFMREVASFLDLAEIRASGEERL
jgi:hypothetical protein